MSAARAAAAYEGTVRHIVHALKYDGRRSLAAALRARMRAADASLLGGATCAVPVPLRPWRRFRCEFNQAALLANHAGGPSFTRCGGVGPRVRRPN